MSINRWIKKENVGIFIYVAYINSATERKKILSFATTWMNLEGAVLTKINQTDKTKTVWSHLYVKFKKVILIETENRMVVARGWGVSGNGRLLAKVYELLDTGWISSEDLMSCMATVVYNTVLYIWNLLNRSQIFSTHTYKKVNM